MSHSEALREVRDSILYITALLNDHPRGIDRHIDYFGEGQPAIHSAGAEGRPAVGRRLRADEERRAPCSQRCFSAR